MSRTKEPIYREIASLLQAIENCKQRNNTKHSEAIDYLCKNFLPSGSGIDCGTKLNWDASNPQKLVFDLSIHHMDCTGYYCGWTEHQCIVTPDLPCKFNIEFTEMHQAIDVGSEFPDDDGSYYYSPTIEEHMGDYLSDTYSWHLNQNVWQNERGEWFTDLYTIRTIPSFDNWGMIRS